jgi:RNA polymerase sigma factor (sigma-70 family)
VNAPSDQELLQDYAERRSEPAFAELVRRHVDVVYSAALRMVCDPHTAEDVTQNTFIALAKNSLQVRNRSVLSSWLHSTARNLAANTVRTEVRRREREQEAAAMNELLANEPEAVWKNIAPHLDDAIAELGDADRDALFLRYFERKSAREMGEILGTSEDAAKKRVSRAVERLREFFSKRGVTIGASGFVVVLSANAVHAAPVTLATTISTAAVVAGATTHASTAITATKVIAMTTLQKTLIAATVVVLAGAGIYEARQTSDQATQIRTLQQQQAPLAAQIQQLKQERDDATNRLAGLLEENSQLKSNSTELLKLRAEVARLRETKNAPSAATATNDSKDEILKSWLAREDKLRQLAAQHPEKSIPEFQLLTDRQWLDIAMNARFETDDDTRNVLAQLRHVAEDDFVSQTHVALMDYLKNNDGHFPTDLSQLQPYFKTPMDSALFQRWQITSALAVPNVGVGDTIITLKGEPIDPDRDQQWAVGERGYGSSTYQSSAVSAARVALLPAMTAYAAANNGKEPTDPSQVQPYITTPEQQAALQTLLRMKSGAMTSSH